MLCYIKSRSDFKTKAAPLVVLDYDIALDSVYDDVSNIVVLGEVTGIEDDFIYIDGWLGVVSSVAPDKGQTSISAKNILSAFSRSLLPASGTYIEAFIKDTLEAQYKTDHRCRPQKERCKTDRTADCHLRPQNVDNDARKVECSDD